MAYRVAIVDDSTTDAEFVKGILNSWAELRQAVNVNEYLSQVLANI